jgi:hypothetical protein
MNRILGRGAASLAAIAVVNEAMTKERIMEKRFIG